MIQATIQEHQEQQQHQEHGEQDFGKKRADFKNPIGTPSYLAASGDAGGLIIGIGDIALAGEKHLSVAVSASMAADRTGVGCSCYQSREAAAAAADEEKMRLRFPSIFILFYPLLRCVVKSIAEDSSEIEHTRCQKTAASSGGFFGWLASFLPSL
jgi:hypothetical protein